MQAITGPNWTVYHADCRTAFAAVPAGSVHCVMTSPPYWGGIRDYQIAPCVWSDGWEGCFGNEPTVQQYVTHTLEIFDVLRRVLRDDGVIWWNLGDTYCTGAGKAKIPGGGPRGENWQGVECQPSRMPQSIAAGNKCLVPFRVAIALQESGWIVRQDIVWAKPSPMPESIDGVRWERCRVKVAAARRPRQCGHHSDGREVSVPIDRMPHTTWNQCPGCPKCSANGGYVLRRGSWRPTTAHEYVLMVTKGQNYFCDAAAAQEKALNTCTSRTPGGKSSNATQGQERANGSFASAVNGIGTETRNPRSVWRISSEAYKGKHFAAYPTMLAWKCIQAATSSAGCCSDCGAQYAPIVEKSRVPTRPGNDTKVGDYQVLDPDSPYQDHAGTICGNRDPQRHIAVKRTLGHRPTCACNGKPCDPVPCVVADPFTGSGTTLQVAINTGRQFIGSEIAEHYLPLIQERAATPWQPRTEHKKSPTKRRKRHKLQRSLFS